MSLHNTRSLTCARDLWVALLLAFVTTLAAVSLAMQLGSPSGQALADEADASNIAVQANPGVDNFTTQGVSPSGTTINVFDYWVTTQGDIGSINQYNGATATSGAQNFTGINKGHVFKFVGGDNEGVNVYTGVGAGPRPFVLNTLVDGYPAISAGEHNGVTYEQTSLAYLFDLSAQEGKASYPGATGLLQQDSQGYYYYDCTKNFASLNTDTNAFTLYNAPAVRRSAGATPGQFFPFTSASTVFNANWNGLSDKGIQDSNRGLNHHFGMTMSTKFVQPSDGMVSYNGNSEEMTYSFSGDDDVWVYIDGVLVGDLGGIHDAVGLNINFHSGEVTVSPAPLGSKTVEGVGTVNSDGSYTTTLAALFTAAGKYAQSGFTGDTFASGTQHTLNFFYLERGAYASNMSLRFNLYSETASDIYKLDQNGNPLAGASFNLYRADESYNKGALIATGTTDGNGQLTLTYTDARAGVGNIISFDEEAQAGYTHFVLQETGMPEGYHSPTQEMRLRYVQSANQNGTIGGSLVSADDADGISSQWKNGGYASAKQTLVLKNGDAADYNNKPLSSGTIFAVVLKRVGSDTTSLDAWQAVTGNALDGYELAAGDVVSGAISAAQAGSDCTAVFSPGPTGLYQATVESLPGSIDQYAYMLADPEQGNYVVAIYHTTADSLAGATRENTSHVNGMYFDHQFACTLYVTNIQNRLWVQKVDDAGEPVVGAQFGLFVSDDVTVNDDGTYTLAEGAVPFDTLTTADADELYNLPGAGVFPLESDKHAPLNAGVYYLAEIQAPDGYEPNNTLTRIVVDGQGVWVDAGQADDGVLSMTGPGALLSSLSQFGACSDFDDTLSRITGTLQSGTLGEDGMVAWADGPSTAQGVKPASTMSIHYADSDDTGSAGHRVVDYVDDEGNLPIIYADTGINRMQIVQAPAAERNGVNLGTLELNSLFTNAVGVQYTDKRVASLEVTKTVKPDEAYQIDAEALFPFKLTLPELAEGKSYDAKVVLKAAVAGEPDDLVGELKVKTGDVVWLKAGETLLVYGLADGDAYTVEELTAFDPSLSGEVADESDVEVDEARTQAGEGGAEAGADEGAQADGLDAADVQAGEPGTGAPAGDGPSGGDEPAGDPSADDPGSDVPDAPANDAEPDFQTQRVTGATGAYMPLGFVLDQRLKGGVEVEDAAAPSAVSGTVAPAQGSQAVAENQLEFVNAYRPAPVTLGANEGAATTKLLSGRDWEEGDSFTFQLAAAAGTPMPEGAEAGEDGALTLRKTVAYDADSPAKDGQLVPTRFGDIVYDRPGTYDYTVTEVQPAEGEALPGVTYSQASYTFTITVADAGGKLVVTGVKLVQTRDDDGIEKTPAEPIEADYLIFTNTYAAATPAWTEAPVRGQKTLDGRAWYEGETFDFTLAPADDATRAAVAAGEIRGLVTSATASAPAEGATAGFTFGDGGEGGQGLVAFDKAGTYTFNVRESAGRDADGMTYDTHVSTVTVTVSDLDENGRHTGVLVASVAYGNSAATTEADRAVSDAAAFTNVYRASGSYAGLTVTKTMQGKVLEAGAYAFTVEGLTYDGFTTEVDENTASPVYADAPAGTPSALTCADGTPLFARAFTQDDLGRVFAYRVSEQHGPDGNGYAYDTSYHGDAVVLIKPTPDADDAGKINTMVSVLKGDKVMAYLNGSDASALTDDVIAGLEDDPDVYVEQAQDGSAALAFVNSYAASLDYTANGGLTVTKTLAQAGDAVGSPQARTYSVSLTPQDTPGEGGATAAEAAAKLGVGAAQGEMLSFTVDGYGSATQDALPNGLTFTQADDGKTYTYVVRESVPDPLPGGYAYDDGTYTVTISVRDNGDGTLTATTRLTRTAPGGEAVELGVYENTTGQPAETVNVPITNTYTVTPATATPQVQKVVAGADATEQFTFVLAAADDATRQAIDEGFVAGSGLAAPDYAATASTTGTIPEGGSQIVSFGDLTFSKVGTYTFTAREDGAVAADAGAWNYDTHVATIVVRVYDDGGALRAVPSMPAGEETLTFSNTYATSTTYGAQGGLQIEKTLTNRTLLMGQFTFVVEPVNDAARAKLPGPLEVTNHGVDDTGVSTSAVLGNLTFGTADRDRDFTFKVYERNDGAEGYTYDDAYYIVTVTPRAHEGGETLYTVTQVQKYDADGTAAGESQTVSSQDGPQVARVAFANEYHATGELGGDAPVKIDVVKKLVGEAAQGGAYTFELAVVGTDGRRVTVNSQTVDVEPGEAGTPVEFGKIVFGLGEHAATRTSFDLAQAVENGLATSVAQPDGTTIYTVYCEVRESLKDLPAGVRPDSTDPAYVVTVTITDNGDGTLTPRVSYPEGDCVTFVNHQDKAKTIGTAADPTTDIDGAMLSVGDEYVYTINWVNNAADAEGKLVAASVSVQDTLPRGTQFVSATDGGMPSNPYDDGTCTVSWELGEKPAGSYGSVQVRVRVTDAAVNTEADETGAVTGGVGVVSNAATVTVGGHESTTNTTTNYVPGKTVEGGNLMHGNANLGDELTYTVYYKNTEGQTATVTVSDEVPTGTAFVAFAGDNTEAGEQDGTHLTWTIDNVAPGAEGSVSFKVKVTEEAFGRTSSDIENQATVRIGENNPDYKTNLTRKPVFSADLVVQKFAYTYDETIDVPDASFHFLLNLMDADGNPLKGSYYFFGMLDGNTFSYGNVSNGYKFEMKSDGILWVYNLPVGARYIVTETDANTAGFTTETPTIEGTMPEDGLDMAFFENTYAVQPAELSGADAFPVVKTLTGRDWNDADAFTFDLAAVGDNAGVAPMPEDATLTLTKDAQTGSFGDIEYTQPGTYTYEISERNTGAGDVAYSQARYRVTVTVADDGKGQLVATHEMRRLKNDAGETVPSAVQVTDKAAFTNTGFVPKTVGTKANPTASIDGQLVSVGGEYTYTVRWVNNTGAAARVTVVDTLPAGTAFVSASDPGVEQDGVVTWELGEQDAGATGSVTVTVRVTGAGVDGDELSNAATITVGEHESTTNTTTNYVPRKDVTLNDGDASVDGQGVKVGDVLTYTVSWRNATASTADVYVSDSVPAGTEFVDFSGDNAEAGVRDGANLAWTVTGAEPGAAGSVSFQVRVTEAALAAGGVDNTATVRVGANSPAYRTNTTHNPTAGVAVPRVTKVLEGDRVPGLLEGEFTFGIEVAAAEGSPADGFAQPASAMVANDAAGNVDFGALSFSKPGTYNVRIFEVVPDEPEPMVEYDEHAYTFDVVVSASEDGALSARVENEQGSSTFRNRFARTSPVKTVEKLDGAEWVDADGAYIEPAENGWTYDNLDTWLRYTISWKNDAVDPETGKACAATVTVRDFWPAETVLFTDTLEINGEAAGDRATWVEEGEDAGLITWTIDAAAGEEGTVSFTVCVSDTAAGTEIENQGTVVVENGSTQETNVTRNYAPKKEVVGDVRPEYGVARIGDEIEYRISYKNVESGLATVTVTDSVPDGTEFMGFTGANAERGMKAEDGTLTWTMRDVAPGAEGTVSFKVKVVKEAYERIDVFGWGDIMPIENQATVKLGNRPAVNTNRVTTQPQTAFLSFYKEVEAADGLVAPDKKFTFKVDFYQVDDEWGQPVLDDAGNRIPLEGAWPYTVMDDDYNTVAEGEFTSGGTVTLKAGWRATFSTLPTGYGYTVTEVDADGNAFVAEDGFASFTGDAEDVFGDLLSYENPSSGRLTSGGFYLIPFKNVYTASGALDGAQNLRVTKDIEGRDWREGDSFTFTLAAGDDDTAAAVAAGQVELPDNAAGVTLDAQSHAGGVAFGDITFRTAGTFTFKVEETDGGMVKDGLAFDDAEKLVRVTVADNGDGTLSCALADDSDALAFTNTFSGPSVNTDGLFTKTLEGRDWAEGDAFAFTMRAVDDAPMPDGSADGAKTVTVAGGSARAGQQVPFGFGSIDFEAPGTYVYDVVEEKTPMADGVVMDAHTARLTVVVAVDEATGRLYVATSSVADAVTGEAAGAANFTNVYAVSKTIGSVDEPAVNLDGQMLSVGSQYTYTLTWVNSVYSENSEDGSGQVSVTDALPRGMRFVAASDGGAYDEAAHQVTWNLGTQAFNAQGTVQVTVEVTDEAVSQDTLANSACIVLGDHAYWTNTTDNGVFEKEVVDESGADVDGRTVKVGDVLTYYVHYSGEGAGASGAVHIEDVIPEGTELTDTHDITGYGYYRPETRTITWTMTAGEAGTVSFKVRVTEDALVRDEVTNQASLRVGENGPTFKTNATHNYTASVEVPQLTKVVAGDRPVPLAEGEFTFDISVTPQGDTPADGFTQPGSATNAADGTVDFGRVSFSKPGTYLVSITEDTSDRDPLMTYDGHAYAFTVVVEQGADGRLSAQIKEQGPDEERTFTNTWTPGENVKTVTKADPATGEAVDVDGKLVSVGDVLTYTIQWSNDAVGDDGHAAASTVTITDEAPEGTTAIVGSATDGGKVDGNEVTWKIDAEPGQTGTVSFRVRVLESAPDLGELANEALVRVGRNLPSVTNEVKNYVAGKTVAKADDGIATQSLEVSVGDVLVYAVSWHNGNVDPAWVSIVDVIDEGLTVDESSISDGGTYDAATRTITWGFEAAGNTGGRVTFVAEVNAKAVKATRVNPITNKADVSVDNEATVTTNTTSVTLKSGDLQVNKVVVGGDTSKEFGFVIFLTDAHDDPVTGRFDDLEFDENGRSEVFWLKDGESKTLTGLPAGTTYDVIESDDGGYAKSCDNHEGRIVAGETVDVTYTNTYIAEPAAVSTDALFSKELAGRAWAEGDVFSFTLTPLDGAPMPEGTDVETGVKTVTVTAPAGTTEAQTFGFGAITFTLDDLADVERAAADSRTRTFSYDVAEVAGDVAGVAYDSHVARLTVTLVDDGAGNLTAAAEVAEGDGAFVNTYTVEPGTLEGATYLAGTKTVENGQLEAGQYRFTLEPTGDATAGAVAAGAIKLNADGDASVSVVNGADGTFAFGDVRFSQVSPEGGWNFKVSEVQPSEDAPGVPGVSYDGSYYIVNVVVANEGGTAAKLSVSSTTAKYAADGTPVAGPAAGMRLDFANSYVGIAPAEVAVVGEKVLDAEGYVNVPDVAGAFSFQLASPEGEGHDAGLAERIVAAEGVGDPLVATNAADGTVSFGALSYTMGDLAGVAYSDDGMRSKTFLYSVTESGQVAGVANDPTATRYFTVTLTDDGQGNLTAAAAPVENAGGAADEAASDDAASQADLDQFAEGAAGDGSQGVGFAGDAASQDASGSDGLAESAPEGGSQDGEEAEPETGALFTFTNTFSASGTLEGATSLAGTKAVTNGTLSEGQYSFTLAPADTPTSNAVAQGWVSLPDVLTVGNDAAGTFHFGDISFTRAGTYSFRVSEVVPASDDPAHVAGVTYDTGGYLVTVKVSEPEVADGTLTVSAVTTRCDASGNAAGDSVANGSLEFTNVYGENAQAALELGGTKTLEGAKLGERTFGFTLKGSDATQQHPLGTDVSAVSETAAAGANSAAFAFPRLTYTMADLAGGTADDQGRLSKTFTYQVSEVNAGQTVAGVSCDAHVYEVAVTVTDKGAGELGVSASVDGVPVELGAGEDGVLAFEGLDFTNHYAPDANATVGVRLEAGKALTGRAIADGEFSFVATDDAAVDDDGAPKVVATGTVAANAGDANEGSVLFSALTFTNADMVDDGHGAFTQNDDGTIMKVLTYTLAEVVPSDTAGVTYDASRYRAIVTLFDNGLGKRDSLTASVAYIDADGNPLDGVPVFANRYSAAPTSFTPQGEKSTSWQPETEALLAGKVFSYEVYQDFYDEEGNLTNEVKLDAAGTSPANGAISFGQIKVDAPGVFYYRIAEVLGGTTQGGVTFDGGSVYLTLTVADNGDGTYSVTPAYTKDGQPADRAYFANSYDTPDVTLPLSATKVLDGRDQVAGEFAFSVTDMATGAVVATGTNDAFGNVVLGSLQYEYSKNDPSEQQPEQPGETMPDQGTSGEDAAVTPGADVPAAGEGDQAGSGDEGSTDVPGADTGDQPSTGDVPGTDVTGDMGASADAPAEGSDADDGAGSDQPVEGGQDVIAESAGAAEAQGLLGPAVAIADDEGVEPYEAPVTYEGLAAADAATTDGGQAADDQVSQDQRPQLASSDLGMHYYTVREDVPAGAEVGEDGRYVYRGVTYDNGYYVVAVEVADNGDGTMGASVTQITRVDADAWGNETQTPVTVAGADGMDNVVFHNSYQVVEATTATLEATKVLTGRDAADGEFGFEVYEGGELVTTGTSSAAPDGQPAPVAFGSITYTAAGEHDYVVREVNAGDKIAGVAYDPLEFRAHVSVTDNGDGTLSAQVSYPDGVPAFENAYRADQGVEVALEGTKTLTGRDMAAGEFSFKVLDVSGNLAATGQSGAAADGQAAAIRFTPLAFTDPGDYAYTVVEDGAGTTAAGVTYDGTSFSVTVHVTDNLDGTLSASVEYPEGGVAFRNSYAAQGDVAVTPHATKTLTGRDLRSGEFRFTVSGKAGNVVSTGTNDAEGNVVFTPIKLSAPGTYTYTVAEAAGEAEGVTYDKATFTMRVTVSDAGDGTLVAAVEYPDGEPVFANSYQEPGTPDGPDRPDQPENPGAPGTPSQPGGTAVGAPSGGVTPKTGDATPEAGMLALAGAAGAASLAVGAGLLARSRHRRRDDAA